MADAASRTDSTAAASTAPAPASPTAPGGGGPQSTRRRGRRWIAWVAVALVFFAILASPFELVRVDWLRERLLTGGLSRLGLENRLRITIGSVRRFTPLSLDLSALALEARQAGGEWQTVSRAGRLRIRWSSADLLAGRLGVDSVGVESLAVALPRLSLLAVGRRPRAGEPAIARKSPPIAVHDLRMTGLRLSDSRGSVLEGDVDFRDLALSVEGLKGSLSGELACPRVDLAASVSGAVRARGGRLEVEDLSLKGEGCELHAAGWGEKKDGESRLEANFDLARLGNPLLARLLSQVFPVEALDAPAAGAPLPTAPRPAGEEDSLAGKGSFSLRGRHGRAEIALTGRLRGEALRALTAKAEARSDSSLALDFDLDADAAGMRGALRWNRSQRLLGCDLDWRALRLDSSWLPWAATLPDLGGPSGGRAAGTIHLPAGGPVSAEGSLTVEGLAPFSIRTRSILARGRWEEARRVEIDSLEAVLAQGGVIRASGGVDVPQGKHLSARIGIDDAALSSLPRQWSVGLTGRVFAQAKVEGSIDDPVIEGGLSIVEPRWRAWNAKEASAQSFVFRPRDLRGEARLQVSGLAPAEGADGGDVIVEVERWEDEISADVAIAHPRGQAELEGILDPAGSLTLASARLSARETGDWTLAQPFHLHWDERGAQSDSLVLGCGQSRLSAALTWSGEEDLAGRLVLRRFDLARLGLTGTRGDSMRGQVDLTVDAAGRWPAPKIEASALVTGMEWASMQAGDASLRAEWGERELTIGPVSWANPDHEVLVRGVHMTPGASVLEFLRAPRPDSSGLLSALCRVPWTGEIEIARCDLAAYAELLGIETVTKAAAAGPAPPGQLYVGGASIPLRILAPWDTLAAGEEGDLAGALTARISLEGTPADPALRFTGEVPDLRFAGSPLGALAFQGAYRDSMLRLEECALTRDEHATRASGTYPFFLSLDPPRARPGEGDASIQARLDDLDLSLLSGLTRLVPDASGRLSGDLALAGPAAGPHFEGELQLEGGAFRIPDRSERITDLHGSLVLGAEGLRIRSLEGRCGPQGTIGAGGLFRSAQDFRVVGVLRNAHAYEERHYDFLANADLTAFTAVDSLTGHIRPHLKGTVEVLGGTFTQDLAQRPPVAELGAEVPWLIDLDVDVPGNIHLSQVNTKADLSEGRLRIVYRWPYWNMSGTLNVIGGTYRLLNNVFTVREGTVEFRDTGAGPDVTMNIAAETSVALAQDDDRGTSETITVEVQLQGKPEELTVSLSSVPPLSEEEIVELLSIGRFSRTGHFEAASETQWIVLNTMVDRIESSLLEQSALFSRVGIAAGQTGEEPLRLTLRPVITPQFLMHYSQELALDPEREVSMNYRLGRGLYLRAGLARDRATSGAFNEEYSLDLRYRIEYE